MENPSAPANELKELRLPPFSKEAEDSILGALLVDNSALDIISDKINANDFYDYGNRAHFSNTSLNLSKMIILQMSLPLLTV